MHDHRTDPAGSNHHTSDEITAMAAQGVSDIEKWLRTPAARPLERVEADAALELAQLALHLACSLPAESDLRAQMLAQGHDWKDLAESRGVNCYTEFEEAQRLAHGEDGVYKWDALPLDLRAKFYDEQVYTIDEVRERARDRKLQAIPGIGPARERQILEALAAIDCNQDWLR